MLIDKQGEQNCIKYEWLTASENSFFYTQRPVHAAEATASFTVVLPLKRGTAVNVIAELQQWKVPFYVLLYVVNSIIQLKSFFF